MSNHITVFHHPILFIECTNDGDCPRNKPHCQNAICKGNKAFKSQEVERYLLDANLFTLLSTNFCKGI